MKDNNKAFHFKPKFSLDKTIKIETKSMFCDKDLVGHLFPMINGMVKSDNNVPKIPCFWFAKKHGMKRDPLLWFGGVFF